MKLHIAGRRGSKVNRDKDTFFRDIRMWDFIAKNSNDEIARGGWKNSYNGKLFSHEEMKEYSDNVYIKLKPFLDKYKTVVLEIGCASGLTMYRLAPYVKSYIGTDMASVNLKINEERNRKREIKNIKLFQCRADEITKFKNESVDLIIINSVIQYFKTEEYLLNVIEKCAETIDDKGIIYIGDVRDKEKKDMYEQSLMEYQQMSQTNRKVARKQNELFLGQSLFLDLKNKYSYCKDITISNKIGELQNELTKYRFDVMIRSEKE